MVTVQEFLCTRLNLRVSYWGAWNQLIIEILMKHLLKIVTLGSEEEEHTPTLTSSAGCRVVLRSTDAQRYRRAGDVMIPPHRGPSAVTFPVKSVSSRPSSITCALLIRHCIHFFWVKNYPRA